MGLRRVSQICKKQFGFCKISNAYYSTHTIKAQTNHFILSILAYAKLEWLKERNNMNHFAMKTKIYQAALKAAYEELKNLSTPKAA